ncbi:MAG: hypothetical protein ACRDJX_11585 [Solirubrobacteraceae bacterium]
MSDYFDRVERALRNAAAERRHVPWYRRVALRPSRGVAVVATCLVATGSALAASGVFQTGTPVAPEVAPIATVDAGAPIPRSVRLLSLRVADPDGGPPWGLRTIKTTRGLMCVQLGRIVDGRIGVLGKDGAFHDDGRFHPLSIDYFDAGSSNCATQDAHGNAFLNEEAFGVPTDGLISGEGQVSVGCYAPHPTSRACPPQDRRNIYYGLLGPDATSITYLAANGEEHTMATAGPDGAYLVVLPHIASPCLRGSAECSGLDSPIVIARSSSGETGGPTLNAFGAVRTVTYRGGSSCHLPDGAEVRESERAAETAFRARLRERYPAVYRTLLAAERRRSGAHLSPHERSELESLQPQRAGYSPESPCPAVGYAPLPAAHFTHAQLASAVHVRIESAAHYCEKGQLVQPCGPRPPAGIRRIQTQPGRHELLVLISFRTRIAIPNYDRHYEFLTTAVRAPHNPRCPGGVGGGGFGPSDSNFRAEQKVIYAQLIPAECHGTYRVTVGLVSTDGPSGSMPVPGLPGQSPEVPVGEATFKIP